MYFVAHDDVIQWKHFPRYWPFVRGIHRTPVNSRTEASDTELLMFSLMCAWINGWVNNREGGDLRRHRTPYDVTVIRQSWTNPQYHCLRIKCDRVSKLNQQLYIYVLPETGHSSKLAHTGVKIWDYHTIVVSVLHGLSVVQCPSAVGIVFLTQFLWHETNVLDNWQLAALTQSGGSEFNPRWVLDNLSFYFYFKYIYTG